MSQDDAIRAVFVGGDTPTPRPTIEDRVPLPGLSPRAWEHPADRAALTALRKIPAFDTMLKRAFGLVSERSLRLLYLANAVEVNERQFTRVHRLFQECCAILDAEQTPQLFIAQTPIVNAGAVGIDEPFIVLNSGTLDLLDDDELRFVLGHELGHALSGHVLYKTMLHILLKAVVLRMGVPGMLLLGVVMGLREWDRKSELSSDRAGLLCLQDPDVAYRVHMKMAGGNRVDEMSVEAFVKQADDYRAGGDVRDGALKFLNLLGRTHPFPVLRLAELRDWVASGAYEKILAGDYPRRDDDASMYDDVTESVQSYRSSVGEAADPFVKALREFGGAVSGGASALWDQVRDAFGVKKVDPETEAEPEPEADDEGDEAPEA